jgi:hypothetical protein
MRPGNADRENIEAKRRRNWKRRAGVVALSAALLGGGAAATTATAATDSVNANGTRVTASADASAAALRYIDHFFWESDCQATGSNGIRSGSWTYWECVNGSGSPFDDYELWVSG